MDKGWLNDLPREGSGLEGLHPIGFVIELGKGQYLKSCTRREVATSGLWRAKKFPSLEHAEAYARKHLGYAGMKLHICQICWTVQPYREMEPERKGWRRFASLRDAEKYQKKYAGDTYIDLQAFRKKRIVIAA